jgi:hypothetical protein
MLKWAIRLSTAGLAGIAFSAFDRADDLPDKIAMLAFGLALARATELLWNLENANG